jgi:hypothetical protein
MTLSRAFRRGDRIVARATGLDREQRGAPGLMLLFWGVIAFGVYSVADLVLYLMR